MNTRVSPASNIESAISFGVFFLTDPSTISIILSRNVSPGSAVILILILSSRKVVEPVTLSPFTLNTAFDSPVIADSLKYPLPSAISPSVGTISFFLTSTIMPFLSSEESTIFSVVPSIILPVVSFFIFLSVAVIFLLFPSASASPRVEKNMVRNKSTTTEI